MHRAVANLIFWLHFFQNCLFAIYVLLELLDVLLVLLTLLHNVDEVFIAV